MKLRLVIVVALFLSTSYALAASTPKTKDNSEARIHYLNGEAALNHGDILTAVVEWETTLELKPDSEATQKSLSRIMDNAKPDLLNALAQYRLANEYLGLNKLDEADKALGNIFALGLSCQPQCAINLANTVAGQQNQKQSIKQAAGSTIVINGAKSSTVIDSSNALMKEIQQYQSTGSVSDYIASVNVINKCWKLLEGGEAINNTQDIEQAKYQAENLYRSLTGILNTYDTLTPPSDAKSFASAYREMMVSMVTVADKFQNIFDGVVVDDIDSINTVIQKLDALKQDAFLQSGIDNKKINAENALESLCSKAGIAQPFNLNN